MTTKDNVVNRIFTLEEVQLFTSNSSCQEHINKQTSRRTFDRIKGIAVAKSLFHQSGFDAVGIAKLTKALDINPPSFYAAYGSKADLFELAIEAYIAENNLPANEILEPERDTSDALKELINQAASLYVRSETERGCMVAEGMRAVDQKARIISNYYCELSREFIKHFIAQKHPEKAEELADYVVVSLQGLSAAAFSGLPASRVLTVAELAGISISSLISS